jgi:ABC-2 type transport system ATP-binding protein
MMLSTLLEPSSGTVYLNDHDLLKESDLIKRDIGILFQEPSLDDRLTGVPKSERVGRINKLIEFVGLQKWAQVPTENYSGGMRRRLEIARCLIHKPKILILDEPTLGLDPNARKTVWKHLKSLKDITMLLATNYIEEAETLCNRVGIMDSGRIVAIGTPEELKSELSMDIVRINSKDPEKLKSHLQGTPWVEDLKVEDSKISFTINPKKKKHLLNLLEKLDLDSMEVRKPTLSDVFIQHTGKTIEIPLETHKKKRGLGRMRRS